MSAKKIIIISDTHGFIHPSIVSLASSCDIAIHAGDIVDYASLEQLQPHEQLIAVAGNNDAHIPHLKDSAVLQLFSHKIVIEHGHKHGHYQPSHESLRQSYPQAKIIIYGHTHKQVIDKTTTPWVVNPGAAGRVRTHGGSSCLILTAADSKDWRLKPLRFAD